MHFYFNYASEVLVFSFENVFVLVKSVWWINMMFKIFQSNSIRGNQDFYHVRCWLAFEVVDHFCRSHFCELPREYCRNL